MWKRLDRTTRELYAALVLAALTLGVVLYSGIANAQFRITAVDTIAFEIAQTDGTVVFRINKNGDIEMIDIDADTDNVSSITGGFNSELRLISQQTFPVSVANSGGFQIKNTDPNVFLSFDNVDESTFDFNPIITSHMPNHPGELAGRSAFIFRADSGGVGMTTSGSYIWEVQNSASPIPVWRVQTDNHEWFFYDGAGTLFATLEEYGTSGIGLTGGASGADVRIRSNSTNDGNILLNDDPSSDGAVIVHGDEAGITINTIPFQSHLAVHDDEGVAHPTLLQHKHTDIGLVAPTSMFARSRGTDASEAVVADNDILGRMVAVGYDGTDYGFGAEILFRIDEPTPGPGAMGAEIVFLTTPQGTESQVERVRIEQDGDLVVLNDLAVTGAVTGTTFNGVTVESHASRHVSAGADEIDGDILDIDWNPANYTPTTAPAEVTSVDELTAHLAGIDAGLGAAGTVGGTGTDNFSAVWNGTADIDVGSIFQNGTGGRVDFYDGLGTGSAFLELSETGTGGVLMDSNAANDGTTPAFRWDNNTLKTSGNLFEIANGGVIGLVGRWDGQVSGGNATSDDFVIGANTNAFANANTGRIRLGERIVLGADFTASTNIIDSFFTYTGTITSAFAINNFSGFKWQPTFKMSVGQALTSSPSLHASPVFQHTAGVTDVLTYFSGALYQPRVDPDVASGTLVTGDVMGADAQPWTRQTGVVAATIPNMIGYGTWQGACFFCQHLQGSHTITNLIHFDANQPTKQGGITVTNQYGLLIPALSHGTTLNVGVNSAIASGATNYFLRSTGTADSVHTGDLRLGDTTQATEKLEVLGNILIDNGGSSGELRIREPSGGGSSYTGFAAPALSGNVVYTLPTADGSSGQILSTNGSGVLSWATDAGGGSGSITSTRKDADQTWTTDTTFADVTDMTFAVSANTEYVAEWNIFINAPGGADSKWEVNCPTGATIRCHVQHEITAQRGQITACSSGGGGLRINTNATDSEVTVTCGIEVAGTSGTVALRHAQFAASGTSTIYEHSTMRYGAE